MNTNQSKLSIRHIIIIGLFAALCYVALTFFKIPIPSPVGKPMLHMGNMFVILAALLFSGVIGGAAGSLGMGLWDVFNGYAAVAYKSFILKFGIGFFTGLVASKGHNKDAKSPVIPLAISSICFIILGIVLMIISKTFGYEIAIEGVEKHLTIIPVLYIFCLILGVGIAIACFFIKKVSIKLQYAILGGVAGVAFNIAGEFLVKLITLVLAGSGVGAAAVASLINLPSTVINGTFSIVVAIILYIPLDKALRKAGLIIPELK